MTIIKKIASTATFLVRHPVLRAGKPIGSCVFDGDDLETTLHFGLYLAQELVGIISLFKKSNPIFKEQNQYQIRGMAVLQNQQKKDFGKALVLHSEAYCKNQNVELIWFNARVEAVGFYEKMGYQNIGNTFEIPDVGVHILMFKKT
ncbi:MAG: GNAT family N-acetyltransferase [Flavobacteriaceae bacterium]|nr:GNAT family N-acetyltransferase [Flavobacteriaceae bacterium]